MKFDWKSLFSSHGRASRKIYWNVFAGLVIVALLARALAVFSRDSIAGAVIIVATMVVTTICNINITIKRLHDMGQSGWWCLGFLTAMLAAAVSGGILARRDPDVERITVALLYLVMLIVTVGLGLFPGNSADNRFGPAISSPAVPEPPEA